MKKNVCSRCICQDDCAANFWSLYDPYNKKCPNWLDGVKRYHRICKELESDERLNSLIPEDL